MGEDERVEGRVCLMADMEGRINKQAIDRAGRLSVAVAVEHGLDITLKRPLLCVAWGVSTSVYKLDNRNVNASRNTLAHQE